jgi:hypothetical protein
MIWNKAVACSIKAGASYWRNLSFFMLSAIAIAPAFSANGKVIAKESAAKKNPADWCAALIPRLPKINLNDCKEARLMPTNTSSVNGFPILMREINADKKNMPALKILLLGGIHGDEQTASSIVFKWLAALQKNHQQEFEWRVVPVLNPDGLLAAKPMRMNARGIDLNRNFPTPNWQKEAGAYWMRVTRSDPRRFPGQAPISEPESKWVHNIIETFKPDVVISVHAPFGVLDLDGPAKPPRSFGRLWYNRVGVYPGSLGNYSGLYKHIPVVTIELPNATIMPADTEVQRIWLDMHSWIRRNVRIQTKVSVKPIK